MVEEIKLPERLGEIAFGKRRAAIYSDGSIVPIIEGGDEEGGEGGATGLEGGPGDGEPGSSGAGEGGDDLVEVSIAGTKTMVTPEMKTLLEKNELDFNRRLSEQGDELGNLRIQVGEIHKKTVTGEGEGEGEEPMTNEQLGAQMFTNPRGVFKYLVDEMSAELRGSFVKRDGKTTFWNDFYAGHEDLKGYKDLVNMVANQEFPKIKALSTSDGAKHIAERTREVILGMVKDFKPGGEGGDKSGIEGAGDVTKPGGDKTMEEEFSLGGLIKKRAQTRRESVLGTNKK